MAMELGSFTPNPSGNNIFSISTATTPYWIDFWVGARTGTTETVSMASFGAVDITNNVATYQTNYADPSGIMQTKNVAGTSTGASCLQHFAVSGGVISKRIELKYVSCASGQFTINVMTASSSYTVYFRVFST